jgi:PAS domain S-box-containing protein
MNVDASRVVDGLPEMVWTALPDGSIDSVNQRWCEFTNLGFGESCGQGWQAAIHAGDLPELLEHWRLIVASGKPGEMEARLRRFDGEYRRFLFRARPLTNDSGQLVKWCGINIDIEDRRQAEEALGAPWWLRSSAREHHFRAVGDNIAGLAALVTPAGGFELGNRQNLEFFGATPEELKHRVITDNVHPDDLPHVLAAWREAVETGCPYDVEERLRRADGVYLWFHTRGLPLRDANEHIVLWYLIRADFDDAKRAEALLAGEKQLFELVASGHSTSEILEAICRLVEGTASGCYCSVVLVESSGTRLEHGAAPSLPTSFITSIVGRPVNIDSGPCAMAATLNKQVIAADLTTETRWAAYEWCPMALAHGLQSCWSTPISSAAGKILGAFALYYAEPRTPTEAHRSLIEQLTHIASIAIERRLSEETLSRVRSELAHVARVKSLGVLTASIAHEVNQPLSGIITNANTCLRMLAADPPNVEGALETARRTIRDGNRASEVIARLHALFSKKDATIAWVDLNEATREVIALSLSELRRYHVILRTELAEDLPLITGDRVQLQQVILNLVRNASHAMGTVDDRPRELLVRSERDVDGCVRLIVKDTGVGFDRESADRLFEAFYTTKNDGMGIGLSVSRSIIESHHGQLWAKLNDGPGATFSFSLPLGPEGLTSTHTAYVPNGHCVRSNLSPTGVHQHGRAVNVGLHVLDGESSGSTLDMEH